jgi:(hydroxyamino)benzene mutase
MLALTEPSRQPAPEQHMTASNSLLSRQSRRLLQVGMAFILFASFEGFVVPAAASPRVALSAHTLSGMQGIFMLAVGLLWPRLVFSVTASWIAFWLFIYGAAAILAAYMIAATWGVGIETISLVGELPHGLSHGTAFQETVIRVVAFSSAPTGVISFALILWGLSRARERADDERI